MTRRPLRRRCPVCDTAGVLTSERWALRRCPSCTHVWADGTGPKADNDLFESDDYASWRIQSDALQQRQLHMANDRLEWIPSIAATPGRVLELGCSTGEVSAELANRGWDAWAIDPSAPAIELAIDRYPSVTFGIGVNPNEASVPSRGYDLVMAFHVLEHIDEIDVFADLVQEVLRPGGHLYLRLPNWDSWSRSAFGDRWPDNMAEHVHHFSPQSMQTFLESKRFEISRMTTKGQSRHWIGGVRRLVSPDWNANETMPTTGDRSQAMLSAMNTIGRPLLALEERFDAGSELLVLARKPLST